MVTELLTDWDYRKQIEIDNTTGSVPLTDYPVAILLDTADLIHNQTPSRLQDDCDDIRFADSDGITPIDYYIEGPCDDPNTKIWVKVPSIPANSTKIIYIYYGNPTAVSESDLTEVCPGGIHSSDSGSPAYETPVGCLASTEYSAGYNCNQAIDGNPTCSLPDPNGNCWFSTQTGPPQWIYFDLGEEKYISGIRTVIYTWDVPMTFDIQVSDNASEWTTVVNDYTVNVGDAWETIPFPETTSRYIRLYETDFPPLPGRGFGECSEFQALVRDLTGPFCTEFFDDFEGSALDLNKWEATKYMPDPTHPQQCAPGDDPNDPTSSCYCDTEYEVQNSELHIHTYSVDKRLTSPYWTAGRCGYYFDTRDSINANTFKISVEGRYDSADPLLGTPGHLGQGYVLTPYIQDSMNDSWGLSYFLHRINYENFKMDRVVDGGPAYRENIPDTIPANENFEYRKLGETVSLESTGTHSHSYSDDLGLLDTPFTFKLLHDARAMDAYNQTQTMEYDAYWDSVLVRKYTDSVLGIEIKEEETTIDSDTYACISAAPVREIICEYRTSSCYADETTVCSLSDYTNAHIGNKDQYNEHKVCCKLTL